MKKWALYSTSHLKHNNKVPCIFWARFPGSSGVKRVCLQCWRARLNPWVGKILWRRKWQTTPLFSPGKSHGWRNLTGHSPWGRKELDTTEQLHFTSLHFWIFGGTLENLWGNFMFMHAETIIQRYILFITFTFLICFINHLDQRTLKIPE